MKTLQIKVTEQAYRKIKMAHAASNKLWKMEQPLTLSEYCAGTLHAIADEELEKLGLMEEAD